MKKWIYSLFLIAALLLWGCNQNDDPQQKSGFIYPKSQLSYGTDDSVFSCEYRENTSLPLHALIEQYLAGPVSEEFSNPFPENVKVLYAEPDNEIFILVLSDSYASLTGIELSVANTCLAKTAMNLTGYDTVVISCESKTLDGEQSITLTEASLILYDESTGSAPSAPASENTVSQ